MRFLRVAGCGLAAVVIGLFAVTTASAQQTTGDADAPTGAISVGPSISLNAGSAAPGDHLVVTFADWEANNAVLSVCGNLAMRGAADCNTMQATGVRLRHSTTGATPVQGMAIVAPPEDCPCVVKATATETGEVAYAPIDLIGHPISALVDPNLGQPLVDVRLSTAGASEGPISWLRQSLGGPAPQLATVSVKNLTAGTISGAVVHGSASRNNVSVADFDLATGAIGPGQIWTGTAEVELPAPSIGTYEWTVTASGAGPVMKAEASSRAVPWLLIIVVLLLVWDLSVVVVRRVQRRRAREQALSIARSFDLDTVIDIRSRDDLPPPPSTSAQGDDPTLVHEPVGASSGPESGSSFG